MTKLNYINISKEFNSTPKLLKYIQDNKIEIYFTTMREIAYINTDDNKIDIWINDLISFEDKRLAILSAISTIILKQHIENNTLSLHHQESDILTLYILYGLSLNKYGNKIDEINEIKKILKSGIFSLKFKKSFNDKMFDYIQEVK